MFMNPDLLLIYKKYLLWTEEMSFNTTVNIVEKSPPFQQLHDFPLDCAGKIVDIKAMDPVLQKAKKGPCKTLKGGCKHICIPLGQNRVCKCEFGYKLHENKLSCLSTPFTDNFLLMTDWTHNKLYQVSLESGEVRGLRTGDIGSPGGVAYDPIRNHVIWGEYSNALIRLMTLNGTVPKVLINTKFEFDAHPDRFFIDNYSGYIYYTSVPVALGGFVGVAVVTPEGKHRQIINYGDQPRAIVIDMEEGIMFWTDHRLRKVLKAYLDGSGQTELNVASDLTFPNGIAIDFKAKQIYITDGYTNRIHSCSYTGPCTSSYTDKDAWLMSIFLSGYYLYYTSWNNPYITRIDKVNFADKIRLSNNPELGRLDDIFVYNSTEPSQPAHRTCSANEGRGPCSTFCFPKGPVDYVCACEDGVNLSDDEHRCENVPATTTTTITTPVPAPVDVSNNTPIIIGSSAAGVVLILAIIIIVICVSRRRNQKGLQSGYEVPQPLRDIRHVSAIYDDITSISDTRRTQLNYARSIPNPSFIGCDVGGGYETPNDVSRQGNTPYDSSNTIVNQDETRTLSDYFDMDTGILNGNDDGHARDMGRSSDYLEPSLTSDSLHSNREQQADQRYQPMLVNAASLMNVPNIVYTINEKPESDYLQLYN